MFEQTTTVYDDEFPVQSSEEEAVRSWRFEEFMRLGFDNGAAFVLMHAEADLGVARRLVRDGCPLRTALAILH
jgi:hypothetical protein